MKLKTIKFHQNKIRSKLMIIKKLLVLVKHLDFYYNHSEKKIQIESFEKHIEAAIELKIPIIIHSRKADDEIITRILKKYKNKDLKILMHCFTGSSKFC